MSKEDQIYLQLPILVPIKDFNKKLHSKKIIKLVFEENKEIKGFVFGEIGRIGGILTKKRKILAIHEIGVEKNSRDLGIGTQLINEIKKIGRAKGVNEISLSVWSFNESAFNFYIKNGFEIQTFRMEIKLQKEGIIMKRGTYPSKRVGRCLKQIYQKI